jgi:hypothetical protein
MMMRIAAACAPVARELDPRFHPGMDRRGDTAFTPVFRRAMSGNDGVTKSAQVHLP